MTTTSTEGAWRLAATWPSFESTTAFEERVADAFDRDIVGHELTVLHDHDTYRHLQMAVPGHVAMSYDVTTTPATELRSGTLTIHGDMGTFTFSRLDDMFDFFRSARQGAARIRPDYWAEKLVGHEDSAREFSYDAALESVLDAFTTHFEEMDDLDLAGVEAQPLVDSLVWLAGLETVAEFDQARWRITDPWGEVFLRDVDPRRYSYRYLWCCHAITAAIAAYDRLNAARS